MKEFSEDIEERLGKAFKSKAGKKYGMSEVELAMKRIQSNYKEKGNFDKDGIKDVEKSAKSYIMNNNLNTKFLRKNVEMKGYI